MNEQKVSKQLSRKDRLWGKRLVMLMMAIVLISGQFLTAPPSAAAAGASGATYFTDHDNWGGGDAGSAADGDMNVGIKNQNKTSADNYDKYPVEFKIANVDKLPTTSAQLLVRALDVDEYNEPVTNPGNGEWDRVYFSSNPADIALGAPYTNWQTSTTWTNNIQGSGVGANGQGYKQEITEGAYLGALSGKDGKWSTSVLTFKPEEYGRIVQGDNYVGITIHHYYQDTRAGSSLANTNWQMTVDWGQLVIDGGIRSSGEITEAGLKVENGKVTIDTSFIPKVPAHDFSMEVNVIERTLVNGEIVERSIGLDKKLFENSSGPEEWKNIIINDVNIDPSKEYVVNIILFDDRGNGEEGENFTNPGQAQHIVTFSTMDPLAADISKSALRSAPTAFTENDFKDKYLKVNGGAPNGDTLESVKVVTLPDAAKGELQLNGVPVTAGQIIPVHELSTLTFVPVDGGFDGTAEFQWNGYNGSKFAPESAKVTINSSPEVQDIHKSMKVGEPSLPFASITDFDPNFLDPGDESLDKVMIITLPDPAKGKLVMDDGSSLPVDVVAGQEIDAADLNKLVFIPESGVVGDVTFDWNGSDGLQYALVPKTITVTINRPPVVSDITKSGITGYPVQLTANDFALAPAYTDPDNHALQHVQISLPADFADSGKLGYTQAAAGAAVYIAPGTTVTLTAAELDSLKFEPAPGLPETATVSFPWNGQDGMHYSETPAQVNISMKIVSAGLTLTASPDKILGDGKTTTELSALLVDEAGDPIAGVEVVFSAPAGAGSFVGTDRAVTDAQGIAKVTYKSSQITGVNERDITIGAVVHNTELGLSAQDDVIVTFLPAAVKGFITKGDSNTPVPGASVRVTLDLNGDGVIDPAVDFDETVVTDADGAYYVVVPKGDAIYNLEVTQPILVNGVVTPVTFKQTAQVGEVTGAGDENFDSEKTITGIVLFKQPNGQSALLSNDMIGKSSVYLKKADGSYVEENGDPKAFALQGQGVFNAEGLAVGEYELEVRYEIEPGKPIVISRSVVNVTAAGEMNITEELVDPYGTITNAITNHTIEGAKVVLHYADTPRNKAKGLTPGSTVTLPALVGFDPNNNASPDQLSDSHGFYAYMVYPETDYYLVVTKSGYYDYKSPTLSVEWAIVKHDVKLSPIIPVTGSVTPPITQPVKEVSLNLAVEKNTVKEGEQSAITVSYKNESSYTLSDGSVKITLPAGAVVVDPAGGIVTGNVIAWKVTNVSAGKGGSFKPVIQWPLIDAADKAVDITGAFTTAEAAAQSSVKINIFSDRFGDLKHYRYILGLPDKKFHPNGTLTRAELAAIVARLTENGTIDYPLPYTDIRAGHWATNYIKIAVKHGYFKGFQDGTFRPDAPITRGELASVMARFLKLEVSKTTTPHFSDTTGHWAGDIIETLYNGKFLSGYPDGTFKPKNNIIRVEAVIMINRMLYRGPLSGVAPAFPDVTESHWGFGEVQEATISHESTRSNEDREEFLKTLEDDVQ